MSRILDVIAPPRFGTNFRWLIASTWLSNLGDGLALAAGPLLVASRTDEPLVIAMAAMMLWLPPLLFALPAGVITDRVDRRRLVMVVDGVRVGVLAVLAALVFMDRAGVAVVLATLFLLASAEVIADNASSTLLPMLVERDDLAVGNARMQFGFLSLNQLAGPPLGGALFALGSAVPFAAQLILVAASVAVIGGVRLPRLQTREPQHPWDDVREGVRWTVRHPAVRTLVSTLFIFNLTFGAAWSVLVLYVHQRLGLGGFGFGLVTAVGAVGGIAGTAAYGWLTCRISLGALMRIGLVYETLTHLALAVTTNVPFALVIFFLFGAHAFIWGTTSQTIRQRVVPHALQGRVGSVNLVGSYGGLVIGSAMGGVLAQHYGVTAPFWFAFAGSAVFVVALWPQMRHLSADGTHSDPA